jgi:hypothetical protein
MDTSPIITHKPENKGTLLEHLKALSLFMSTVVIALFGTILTAEFNNSQIEINRNKELSVIIPQLTSPDRNVRKQAIIAMSLYGVPAIFPLAAIWDDGFVDGTNQDVSNSIVVIGKSAIPELLQIYNNPWETPLKRDWSLMTLCLLKYPKTQKLIESAFKDATSTYIVLEAAAMSAGVLKYSQFTPELRELVEQFKDDENAHSVVINSISALGFIPDSMTMRELSALCFEKDSSLINETLTSLARIGSPEAMNTLSKFIDSSNNKDLKYRASFLRKRLIVAAAH